MTSLSKLSPQIKQNPAQTQPIWDLKLICETTGDEMLSTNIQAFVSICVVISTDVQNNKIVNLSALNNIHDEINNSVIIVNQVCTPAWGYISNY